MVRNKFELYKIKRMIKIQGKSCIFRKYKANKFNEDVDGYEDITAESPTITIDVLYHEESSNSSYGAESVTDGSIIRRVIQPMLLCDMETIENIEEGFEATLDDKKFKVVSIKDINKWGIIADISLEVL